MPRPKGFKHSEKTKVKMSAIAKERNFRSHFKSKEFRFKKGHIPWNKALTKENDARVEKLSESLKGRKPSPSAFRKGKNHPMFGKHHTTEYKRRPSKKLKGHKFSEEQKHNISRGLKGHKVSVETKKNMSVGQRRRFQRPEEIAKLRENRLKQILPRKDTSIERKLQEALKRKSIPFKKHIALRGQPDIFIKPNLCVFADGDYWHKYPDGRKQDRNIDKFLTQNGFKVLRFWGHEIRASVEDCVERIGDQIYRGDER